MAPGGAQIIERHGCLCCRFVSAACRHCSLRGTLPHVSKLVRQPRPAGTLNGGARRATSKRVDKIIRKYASHKEMKADEYRYWQSRPVQ